MDKAGLEGLTQQLELVKDSIKDTTLAAHKRNMTKGYEMTRVLLDHKISTDPDRDLLKEEACSPKPNGGSGGSRNHRGLNVSADAVVAAVPAVTARTSLCYATPPPDLGTWFSTPNVLSCQDEVKRAKHHPLFPKFLVKTMRESEESWVFGGEDEENDPYADLYAFMDFVTSEIQDGYPPEDSDSGCFFWIWNLKCLKLEGHLNWTVTDTFSLSLSLSTCQPVEDDYVAPLEDAQQSEEAIEFEWWLYDDNENN